MAAQLAAGSLSDAQRADLHGSIHAYLAAKFSGDLAAKFAAEAGVEGARPAAADAGATQLERKWVSVVRLQRRVLELERAARGGGGGGR